MDLKGSFPLFSSVAQLETSSIKRISGMSSCKVYKIYTFSWLNLRQRIWRKAEAKNISLSLSPSLSLCISKYRYGVPSKTVPNLHMTSSPLEFWRILCLRSHADAKAYDRNGRITAVVKLGQRPWEGDQKWSTPGTSELSKVQQKNTKSKKPSRILQYQVFDFLWNLSNLLCLPRCFPTWKDRRCKRCRGCCRRRGWMPEFRHEAHDHSAPKFEDHEIDLTYVWL